MFVIFADDNFIFYEQEFFTLIRIPINFVSEGLIVFRQHGIVLEDDFVPSCNTR